MSKDLPREVLSQLIWSASEQGERAREPPSNAPSTSSDPDPNPNMNGGMPCRKRKQLPVVPLKRKGMGRFGKKCRLLSMLWLTTGFFFVEIVVGYVTNSMALVADSFHMLSDVAALIIAFISVKMSPKKWSKNTFGWARAEVLGALVNAVFLVALCFSITVEACKRFIEPEEIHDPQLLLIVGGAGLAVNLIGLALFHEHGSSKNHSHSPHGLTRSRNRLTQLAVTDDNENDETYPSPPPQEPPPRSHGHGHSHGGGGGGMHGHSHSLNMNMRGVFLHVLSDALGSVIVVISALVVWLSTWKYKYYLDPALSIILVVLILKSVWPLLKDSALILLQTVPTHIQVDDIQRRLLAKVDGVLAVHEFHVWQLAGDRIIASAHIRCRNLSEYMKIAGKVKEFFHNEGIHSTTIQPEFVDYADYPANSDDGEQTDDCILDCPNTLSDSCIMNTCCGPSKEGKDTPSPGDTPYLCRQRTSTTSSNSRTQEMNEMENGALLNEVTALTQTECCCNTRTCACNAQVVSIVGPESCV